MGNRDRFGGCVGLFLTLNLIKYCVLWFVVLYSFLIVMWQLNGHKSIYEKK